MPPPVPAAEVFVREVEALSEQGPPAFGVLRCQEGADLLVGAVVRDGASRNPPERSPQQNQEPTLSAGWNDISFAYGLPDRFFCALGTAIIRFDKGTFLCSSRASSEAVSPYAAVSGCDTDLPVR